jgi:hypothetical protein
MYIVWNIACSTSVSSGACSINKKSLEISGKMYIVWNTVCSTVMCSGACSINKKSLEISGKSA